MPKKRLQSATVRRHTAIVFTDIVGYTALMGSDEGLVFEVFQKRGKNHQQLI